MNENKIKNLQGRINYLKNEINKCWYSPYIYWVNSQEIEDLEHEIKLLKQEDQLSKEIVKIATYYE